MISETPTTLDEFCDWCTQWIRLAAGDAEGRINASWVVASPSGITYGPLASGGTDEARYIAAAQLGEAAENHSARFFAFVLPVELPPRFDGASAHTEDAVVVGAYSVGEERHLMTRDGKTWEQVPQPGGAYTEIGRKVAADLGRGADTRARQEMIASVASPILDRLATEALETVMPADARVARPSRLTEVATELAAALPKARQKKLIRLATDYLEAWLPGSTSSLNRAKGRTTLVALLITQVASERLEEAGLRSILIDHARHGHVGVIYRDGLDLDSITDHEFELLRSEEHADV